MAADRDRPISPHLQVYRLPLTGVLSILHRITGVILALGATLLVLMLMAAAAGSQVYQSTYVVVSHWGGQIVLFGFTLALYYHFCAGIRHLVWDAGHGFELETARRSSWAVVAGAVALTVMTWILALSV